MIKLYPLLILIQDQLTLLDNSLASYINQISREKPDRSLASYLDRRPRKSRSSLYALHEEVKKAGEFCTSQRVDYLHEGVEHIIESILKDSWLKRDLYNFAVRLTPLKDQLGEFILTITIQDDRKKLSRLLLSVEHDLEEMKELVPGDKLLARKIDEFFSLAAEAKKDLERAIPQEKELEVIRRFSSLSAVIKAILLNINSSERYENSLPMQALRKVLLHDWNTMISLLKDKFEEIYTQKIEPKGVFLSSKENGAVGFRIL